MLLDRYRLDRLLFLTIALISGSVGRAQCLDWTPGFGSAGLDGQVFAFAVFDDGHGPALFAAGSFLNAGGTPANCVAKWDGSSWSALGTGLASSAGVTAGAALAVFDDGSGPALYVAGAFDSAGGVPANNIAKWNGSSWSALGAGTDDVVHSLATYDDGGGIALYAGGDFRYAGGVSVHCIAKWNGSIWTPLGGGMSNSPLRPEVWSLAVFGSGSGSELYAAGAFSGAGGSNAKNLAGWNGSSWSAAGLGLMGDFGLALTVFDDGSGPALVAGGLFTSVGPAHLPASNIARWDGSSWSALASGLDDPVLALTVFDDGDGPALYAGGQFVHSGSTAMNGIARWESSSWSQLGSGVSGPPVGYPHPLVSALGVFDDGRGGGPDLYAGGLFSGAGAIPSQNLGEWRGCSGSISLFCSGDGTVAACPCSNYGLDRHGCENSASTGGARLSATGTTSPDTILLYATGELPSALSIFLQGDQVLTGAVAFGDGLRCVGGHLRRLYVKSASAGSASAPGPGDPSVSARSAALGDPLGPGSTRAYQTYYRDSNSSFCPPPAGNTWNVTNGQIIRW